MLHAVAVLLEYLTDGSISKSFFLYEYSMCPLWIHYCFKSITSKHADIALSSHNFTYKGITGRNAQN